MLLQLKKKDERGADTRRKRFYNDFYEETYYKYIAKDSPMKAAYSDSKVIIPRKSRISKPPKLAYGAC